MTNSAWGLMSSRNASLNNISSPISAAAVYVGRSGSYGSATRIKYYERMRAERFRLARIQLQNFYFGLV